MSFEEQMKHQETELENLRSELSRLNAELDRALKEAGVSEGQMSVSEDDLPPDARKAWEGIKEAARRAGEERKARAEAAIPGKSSGGTRRGAVRV